METSQPGTISGNKVHLERICYRCHRVNRRGSLCLLLLHDGGHCARRTFLQRHQPDALSSQLGTRVQEDLNPLTPPVRSALPPACSAPSIQDLRAEYGRRLSRWRGLFARLGTSSTAGDVGEPSE
jgi:hypothetical protein